MILAGELPRPGDQAYLPSLKVRHVRGLQLWPFSCLNPVAHRILHSKITGEPESYVTVDRQTFLCADQVDRPATKYSIFASLRDLYGLIFLFYGWFFRFLRSALGSQS